MQGQPAADEKIPDEVHLDLAGIPGAEASLSEYGMSSDALRDWMIGVLRTGQLGIPFDASTLRTDPAKRLRFVQTFGPILRKAEALPSFRAAWARERAIALQSARGEVRAARGADQMQREQADELRKQLRELEAQANDPSTPAEMRKALQEGIAAQREALRKMEGDPSMAQAMSEAEREQAREEARRSEERVREAQMEWPADHRVLVRQRLQEFLQLSGSIDWNAKLRDDGGRKRFVDPALERKEPRWKMLFRAGRPAADAASGFAREWLKELGG